MPEHLLSYVKLMLPFTGLEWRGHGTMFVSGALFCGITDLANIAVAIECFQEQEPIVGFGALCLYFALLRPLIVRHI